MTNVLDAAADRLRGHWIQHDQTGPRGGVCAVGAVYAVTGDHELAFRATVALSGACFDDHGVGLIAFNDRADTTEEDILLVFKKASARMDEAA